MTLNEFKAWFEGFTDGMADAPTPEQWAKVKAKVGLLASAPLLHDYSRVPQLIGAGQPGAIAQSYGVLGKPGPDHKIQN